MQSFRSASAIKKVIVIIIFIVIALLAAKFLLTKKDEVASSPTPPKPGISVKLAHTNNTSLTQKKSFIATVNADKSIQLSSKLSGYVEKVYVNEGQEVKKGELLITIDSTEINANIDSLKSSLKAMQQDLDYKTAVHNRNQKLYDKKALSKEKLELSAVVLNSAKSNIEATQQKINSLNNQLEYLNIKAPFDGIVSNIFLHQGDLAAPAKPIVKLNSKKQKLIFTFVDERIKKGLKVLLENSNTGSIRTVYDDAKNGLRVAEVSLTQTLNKANGQNVDIEVIFGTTEGCLVDARAILYNDNKTQLLLYKENRFHFHDVDLLLVQDNQALIAQCVDEPVAISSQSKLAILPQYKKIHIIEDK